MEKTKRMTENDENTLKELQQREIYRLSNKLRENDESYVYEAINHDLKGEFTPYPMLVRFQYDELVVIINARAGKYRLTAVRHRSIYCQELEFDSVDDIYELIVKIKQFSIFDVDIFVKGTIRVFMSNLSNNKPKKEEK